MQRLNNVTALTLSPEVAVPTYDRSEITPGIVHLGVGAFHRAHQAPLVEDCLSRGEHTWGIVAASLRSPDTREALLPQNFLYTLTIREGSTQKNRVIGSVTDILVGPEDPLVLVDILADPRIRIVTLTITEKGYTANLANRDLRLDHPDVIHDQANPSRPRSALGFLVEAIRLRRQRAVAPFTVLSCDNIPSNGKTLKALLVQFADLRDPDLASYIGESVSCPSCMVDRIVPATTDRDRADISGSLGVEESLARGDRTVLAMGNRGLISLWSTTVRIKRRGICRRRQTSRKHENSIAKWRTHHHRRHRPSGGDGYG